MENIQFDQVNTIFYTVQELAIFPISIPNFKSLIMHTFLVIFWYFLAMHHLNDRIKASLDLKLTTDLHKLSKTKVPKNNSFQCFLESIIFAAKNQIKYQNVCKPIKVLILDHTLIS